jgi:hypothetical protein
LDPSEWLSAKVVKELRRLLESKHLYQSILIDRDGLLDRLLAEAIGEKANTDPGELTAKVDQALTSSWHAHDTISVQRPRGQPLPPGMEYPPSIGFFLQKIEATCATCKALKPMNMVRQLEISNDYDRRWAPIENREGGLQDFLFAFQCQSCRAQPEAFLVRRRGLKLTLCGRSPMEYVCVPEVIPKGVRKYLSDAIVAGQSGKVLAGLYYLRVLIEQHARAAVSNSENSKVDQALDSYTNSLRDEIRRQFPSLREIYGRLSEAIHHAHESDELFEESFERIVLHFQAIQIYDEAAKWGKPEKPQETVSTDEEG